MARFSRFSYWVFSWAAFVLVLVTICGSATAQDLRDRFGTRNLNAARALDEGIRLVQDRKYRGGLAKLELAIKNDPNIHLAYYWKAIALQDLGEIDKSVAVYEELVKVAQRSRISATVIDGCINCALTQAKLDEEEKASIWFTRAIMLDPTNARGLHWKAYRNMAIAQHTRGHNLSAAMCAVLGFLASPERVEAKMVEDFIRRSADEEVGQVLYFKGGAPELKPRAQLDGALAEQKEVAAKISGKISRLMLDVSGGRVLAIASENAEYFVIDYRAGNRVTKVTVPAKIKCASISSGRLFAVFAEPNRLVELEVATGKVLRTWELPEGLPASITVLPGAGIAAYPLSRMLHTLDLDTGKQTKSAFFSTGVADDPTGRFVYSFVRPEYKSSTGHILIRGRPIFFNTGRTSSSQTTVYRFAVAKKKVLPASFRTNAASNGRILHVSPSANWITLIGGGGWQPKNAAKGSGYGVAVFDTNDFSKLQGFFPVGAYPLAAAVNPVTRQVVVVRGADARVYHLSDSKKYTTLKGPFGSGSVWSGDGQSLFVLGAEGLRVFRQELAAAELKFAKKWASDLAPPSQPSDRPAVGLRAEAMPELAKFAVLAKAADVKRKLKLALAKDRVTRPLRWTSHSPYIEDPKLAAYLRKANADLNPSTAGVHIYRLKKLAKEHPDHVVIDFLLGMAYFATNRSKEALKLQVKVIRRDQGRTNLSVDALRCIGKISTKFKEPARAAYCYATILSIDRYNKTLLDEAEVAFRAAGLADSAAGLIKRGRSGGQSKTATVRRQSTALPDLPIRKRGRRMRSEQLFRKVAPSVVMIRTASGTGSGVCIGKPEFILTNHHVIESSRGRISVFPYAWKDGKLVRLQPVKAEIVLQSRKDDIAVLRLSSAPKSLKPLTVANRAAPVGSKIFALGSPGLGAQVLEQTFTEGIISATQRTIDRSTYLQHSAAINPGNSGGPLVDEFGQIVGIVTLKARLENVGFAIPVSRVRAVVKKKK